MVTNFKFGLIFCILATLCACGGAPAPATPTTSPVPAALPTQVPTLAAATAIPAPSATPKPTDAPKPTEAPATPTPESFPATAEGLVDALKADKELSIAPEPGFPEVTLKYAGIEIKYQLLTTAGTQPTAYVKGVTSEAMNTGLSLVKPGSQEAKDISALSYAGTGLEKLSAAKEVKFATRSQMLKAVDAARKILGKNYEEKAYDSGTTGYGFLNRKDGKFIEFIIVPKNEKNPKASSAFFADISNSMIRSIKDAFYGQSQAQVCTQIATYAKDLAYVNNQFDNVLPKYKYRYTRQDCGITQ